MNRSIISSLVLTGLLATSNQVLSQSLPVQKESKDLTNSTRIIGGKEALPTSYPFMTALISGTNEGISPFCGASFVGGRYVLTAAHCIEGSSASDVDVWIGGFDTTKPETGKRVKVAQIYAHESYDSFATNNDIAILELVEDIQGVTPIKMVTPEIEATLNEGFEFTVMGWGNTNTESPSFPQKLREVNVPLYNRAQCLKDYTPEDSTESGITEQMLCAGFVEGGKDSCQGDSGGPLVFQREGQWYQAGVVSFGNGCAEANAPGIYTRLSQFNQWMSEKQAGVSYLQYTRQGYVEKSYDEVTTFNVKNVSKTAFSITNAKISTKDNIEAATITDNQCLNKSLAYNDSCDIKVQVKTNTLGSGNFTLQIDTDNQGNKQEDMFFSSTTLEQESLDVAALVGSDSKFVKWWGGGDANWETNTSKTSQGDSSAASGDISHYESSVLLATISNDRVTEFNFDHLVSSEEGYDVLVVLHNNKPVVTASGTEQTEFESKKVTLAPGNDRIAFIFRKDSTDEDAIGDDKAYIDKVSTKLTNKAPDVKVKQTSISIQEGQNFTLDASGTTDADGDAITYKWEVTSTSKVPLTNATSAKMTLKAPSYKDAKSLSFKVTATDALGATSTKNVNVTITKKPSGGSIGFALLPLLVLMFRRKL